MILCFSSSVENLYFSSFSKQYNGKPVAGHSTNETVCIVALGSSTERRYTGTSVTGIPSML